MIPKLEKYQTLSENINAKDKKETIRCIQLEANIDIINNRILRKYVKYFLRWNDDNNEKITRGELEEFLQSGWDHANKYEKKEDNNSNNDNHQQKDDIQENIDNIFKNINDFHLKDIIGKEIERRLINQFNDEIL